MQNRRTFLQQSSAAALGGLLVGPLGLVPSEFDFLAKKQHYVPGVQLYTLLR